jgi:hypothetical protein
MLHGAAGGLFAREAGPGTEEFEEFGFGIESDADGLSVMAQFDAITVNRKATDVGKFLHWKILHSSSSAHHRAKTSVFKLWALRVTGGYFYLRSGVEVLALGGQATKVE